MLSRRDFIKGIAAGTLSVVGMGVLSAVAPAVHAEAVPVSPIKITDTIYSTASWRKQPDPIPESEISEVRDVDVCVIGLGHAGATCAVTVAESGFSVVAFELQTEEAFSTTGNDFGHINSKISEELGGGSGAVTRLEGLSFRNTDDVPLYIAHVGEPEIIMRSL